MAGTYTIQWANGLAFNTFHLGSQIEIVGDPEENYANAKVFFYNTNQEGGKSEPSEVGSTDGYTLEFVIVGEDAEEHRAVVTEWVDQTSGKTMLFGNVFIGDPDGAGGFGGEQGGGSYTDAED